MSDARQRILGRLRSVRRPQDENLFRATEKRPWDRQQKIERFRERMTEVRAEVHLTREDEWVADLVAILTGKGVKNLLLGSEGDETKALTHVLPAQGIRTLLYDREIESWKGELFEGVDAGFTGCLGGIAETGSLILWPDRSEPRLLSLVPPIHCVLLRSEQLYSTFAEAVEDQGWVDRGLPTNALLVSGPSKSADIAQVLAYGVHGPRELLVLLVV